MGDEEEIDIELLMEDAKHGDALAQCTLGILYIMGKGVPQSYRKGKMLLEQSVDQGCEKGYLFLGLLHKTGAGAYRSPRIAAELFEKGAMLGDPFSQYELG